MKKQSAARWLTLCLAAGMLTATTAHGQQKYRLRDNYAPGDLSSVDSTQDMNVLVQIKANGEDAGQVIIVTRDHETYREQTIAVDAKGLNALRRTYTVARSVTTDPTGMEHRRVSSLQGKTVVIRRQGDEVKVTTTQGKLAPQDRKTLVDALDHTDMEFYPDHEVAPGDEWTVDPNTMVKWLQGFDKSDIKCRFQEVAQHAGHPCAHIQLTMDLSGQPEGSPGPITMKLAGDMYQPLDLKRPLGVELTGPVSITGRQAANGVTLFFSGEGTMRITETRRWLKVNGKTVVASK